MKTKFSELLKVRKQKVSEIERKLASIRAQKARTLTEIAEIRTKIEAFMLPESGDFNAMRAALAHKEFLYRDKLQKENMLKYFDQEINTLNILYKEASLEYEKIKHLDALEREKIMEAEKREEAKRLDEIAGQLFLRKQKGTV